MQKNSKAVSAFTLVELMVVLGIVSLLSGLLIPVALGGLRSATLLACQSNLHQISVCCINYAAEHRSRLPAEGNKGDRNPKTSPAWFYQLPPYADGETVQDRNSIFQCPGSDYAEPRIFSHASPKSYKMNSYLDNDGRPQTYRLGKFKDESLIVLFTDAVSGETGMGQWGHATRSAVSDDNHPGAINVLYLDGHSQKRISTPADAAENGWGKLLQWKSSYWPQKSKTKNNRKSP